MSEPITPTTVEVRAAYRRSESSLAGSPHGPWLSPVELHAEFDRWLAAHDAEVLASATPAPVSGDDREVLVRLLDIRAIWTGRRTNGSRTPVQAGDLMVLQINDLLADLRRASRSPAVQVDPALRSCSCGHPVADHHSESDGDGTWVRCSACEPDMGVHIIPGT